MQCVGPSLKESAPSKSLPRQAVRSWFFFGNYVPLAVTAPAVYLADETKFMWVRLTAVFSRVRLQRSYVCPIAPQKISSWISLLHSRSRPTCCRHLVFFIRPSCVAWFASINLTSWCAGKRAPRSMDHLRLNQAHRGLCQGREPMQSFTLRVVSSCHVRSCHAFRFVRQRTPVSEKFVAHAIEVAARRSCTVRYT